MSSFTIDTVVSERTGRKSYIARWDFIDADGKRKHRKKSFRTKDKAKAHLLDMAKEVRDKTYIEPTNETTGQYLKRWADGLGGTHRSPSTIHQYRMIVAGRFKSINGVRLQDLKVVHIDDLLKEWQETGYATHTQHNSFRVLKTALKEARRSKLITQNPADDVKAPRKAPFRPTIWTPQQTSQFLEANEGNRDSLLFHLLLKTMMREGEIAALTWNDVDLDAGTLSVRNTLTRDSGGRWIAGNEPKSESSRRDIPIGKDLVRRLREQLADQEARRAELGHEWIDDNSVLDRGNGERYSTAVIQYRWKVAMERQSVGPALRPHDARHSGASVLIAAGVPIKTVSQLLGHADVAFTMRLYVHPQTNERRDAAELLDRMTQKRYDKRASRAVSRVRRATKAPKPAAGGKNTE